MGKNIENYASRQFPINLIRTHKKSLVKTNIKRNLQQYSTLPLNHYLHAQVHPPWGRMSPRIYFVAASI